MDKRKTQRKVSQKLLAAKSKDARFIAEYVKRKMPQLYTEADDFLNHLRTLYPDKRDYTKTHEFLVETTGFVDYKEYYNRTKLKKYKQKASTTKTTTTTTTTTTTVDNMELNVVLIPEQVVKENTTRPFQLLPDETYRELVNQITSDPSLEPIFNDMVNSQDLETPHDTEVDQILNGLLQQTPLEKELEHVVYK